MKTVANIRSTDVILTTVTESLLMSVMVCVKLYENIIPKRGK